MKGVRADPNYQLISQAQIEKTRREKLNEYIKSRNAITRSKTPNPNPPLKTYSYAKMNKVAQTEQTDEKKPQKAKYSAVDYSQVFTSGDKSE